jgi:hypothetical protein
VPVERWPVEEFTYLDIAACAGTTYAEREGFRDAYWGRCDPLWADSAGCESFADFMARVRSFEGALGVRDADETVVVYTHGLIMQALLWLQLHSSGSTNRAAMQDFDRFRRSVLVPNCAILRAATNGNGRIRLSPRDHRSYPGGSTAAWQRVTLCGFILKKEQPPFSTTGARELYRGWFRTAVMMRTPDCRAAYSARRTAYN